MARGPQTGREGFVAGVLVLGLFGLLVLFVYLCLLPTFNHSLSRAEFLTKVYLAAMRMCLEDLQS